MSHSRSHKKNPSPSSNRHDDRKSWDTITKSEFLKIKESMTPEERQALKDFTNPAKLANFDPDWVPPETPDLPTDWDANLPKIDDILNDSIAKKKYEKSLPKGDEEPSSPDRPVWLPEGEDIKKMSATVRRAVAEIVQPVYEELVAQAHTAMEKSLGLSLVHCLWLEILNQQGCKSVPPDLELLLGNDNRQKTIDQFLKLTNAKIRISNILTRLQELRLKQQNISPLPQAGTTKWSGPGVRAANDVNSSKKVQNPKFDDKNQSPDFPIQDLKPKAQDQEVQNKEFAHENQTSESPSRPQTWKNIDLAPKTDFPFPLPSSTSPLQKDPNVQNCKFDDKNQATEFSTQDLKPKAQDQNVQNCKFDDKNQMPDFPNQDLKPKAQDPIVQNPKSAHES
jgi:hypothetical protein